MSNEFNTTNNVTNNQAGNEKTCSRSPNKRSKLKVFLAALAFASVGSVIATHHSDAQAHDFGQGHGGRHSMMHGDRGDMEKRLDGFVKNAVPNATEQQRKQIKDIANAARDDLKVIREQNKSLREQSATILTAQKVDRNALEQQRQKIMKVSDQASVRVSKAIADIADVLSVEQRKEMAEKMKKRMG